MKRLARRCCICLALVAAIAVLMTTGRVLATVQGGPALQFPWPSGVQHNINGGSTYNCPPYHNTTSANNYPYYDNADYYAIDFALNYEPVTAFASGTVRFSGEVGGDGYGQKIEIDHPGGGSYFTIYAHLYQRYVAQGATVVQGQVIGLSGQSGGFYDPHLHFQLQSGLDAAIPEPLSGISDFGQYCLAASPFWMSRPPWQPEYVYQDWGSLWGQATESATASALDMSQAKFIALARVNASAGGIAQWRQWNYNGGGTWNNWTTISGLSGINGRIAMSNHRNGSQEQLHVAAVKNGDIYHTSRVGTGNWSSWTNISHPPGVTFDGAVAISNSDVRVVVAGISGGNVWVRLRYSGSWGVWVGLGGGNTLTGSLAIATRPNGMYHIAALRFDGHIFTTCSTNFAQWNPGWADIGWIFGDALAIDNDAASGACGIGANPGVVVLGFSGNVAFVWCWEAYCPQPYDQIGGAVGGPAAISNTINPYSGDLPPNAVPLIMGILPPPTA